MIVRHKCHNPKCCNPEHLQIGTHKDNWNDSKVKLPRPKGRRFLNEKKQPSLTLDF